MGTREGELPSHRTLEELLEASRGMVLERMPGHGVKRSRFTTRMLVRDHPMERKAKRKKPKARRDSSLRKKRIRSARYRAEALLDRDKCYQLYRARHGERWQITLEEWYKIWEEAGLEGTSPIVTSIYPKGVMSKYSVVIRPKQERKLRATIYDGEEQKIHDLML